MAFGMESQYNTDQNVMWDFRQFYVDWVKTYIMNFSVAHMSNDYPRMLEALEKWHGVIWGRTIKEFTDESKKDPAFEKLKNDLNKLSNNPKYKTTYFRKDRDAEAVYEISCCINAMVVYVIWLMKKHKLFGSETINRGL